MATAAEFGRLAEKYKVEDIPALSDPDKKLYHHFGMQRGRLTKLLGPKNWGRGLSAVLKGHGIGRVAGDPLQMPGVMVLHNDDVLASFFHDTPSDRPDYIALARNATKQVTANR